MSKEKAGTQMEAPGIPAPMSERDQVEDALNESIANVLRLEKELRLWKGTERRMRAQLAVLPREG